MARTPHTRHNTPSKHTGEQGSSGPGHRMRDTTMRHNTPSRHPGEQEPKDPGHRTHNPKHRASTSGDKSQVAQDTARATQCSQRAHR